MIDILSWFYTEREADKTGSAQGWPCLAWPALTKFSLFWYGLVKSGQDCGSCQIHPCPALTHYEAIRDCGIQADGEIKNPVPYSSKETLLKHNSKVTQNMLESENHLLKSRLLGNPWNVSPLVSISVLLNCFPTWYLPPLTACGQGVGLHCAKLIFICYFCQLVYLHWVIMGGRI